MMRYKGYVGRVEYDPEDDTFFGMVLGTRDVITFEGRSVEDLHREFEKSVDVYLDVCAEARKRPDRPFSGKFLARIDPDLHRDIATQAAVCGMSLNNWISDLFREAVNPQRASRRHTRPKKGRRAAGKRVPPRARRTELPS
jgi:predicted HicB family RNase H-like nuclease